MNLLRACRGRLACLLCLAVVLGIGPAAAAAPPAPKGGRYPGTIAVAVDLTDTSRRLLRVAESLPVRPGPLTLWYPEWLPGNHAPRGPIEALAGLIITTDDGRRVEWTRDPVDSFAFRMVVPKRASRLNLEFQYASPLLKDQGRFVATPEIVGLQWNAVVLYPAGFDARRIEFEPSITVPAGWQFGTALDVAHRDGDRIRFASVSLDTLIDSPIFAGRHFRQVLLSDPDAKVPVRLNVVADDARSLEITSEQLAAHRALVQEALLLYGSQHYVHYDFLLGLSGNFSGIGLEHHQSSENALDADYFSDWDKSAVSRSLLPHEYTHSWNGKFRRPADLWTPHFNTPMRNSGLWVYEGMTQYWGQVLSARSGLWKEELARDSIAAIAASLDRGRPGRRWRALSDTTNQPLLTPRRPLSFASWQRSEDYYNEGLLIWLDADTKLRELTQGQRSLDDFARRFFGVNDGSSTPELYGFEDVVAALNDVAPFDWSSFLDSRLESHGPGAPLDGLARSGWKLVYTDKPSEFTKGVDERRKTKDFSYSLGIVMGKDGELSDVLWDSPAFNAGLAKGMTLVAVDGRAYSYELLRDTIKAAKSGAAPIELLMKTYDRYSTVKLDYHDGLQYPHLERIDDTPDRLADILRQRRPNP